MGKNKLKKFAEMEQLPNVFQFPFAALRENGFPLKGHWNSDYFHNDNPIVLELGCGRGEYTVGLAERIAAKNYIGVDIKGARMWAGAKHAALAGLGNVAFLRTNRITFPDPQMKKVRKRLTSTRFLELYRHVLVHDGIVHLKTDSPFLYTYTDELVRLNGFDVEINTADLYNSGCDDEILGIKTYYEQQWLDRGLAIKYIKFHLDADTQLQEPDIEIEHDTYRSFSRGYIQKMITPPEGE